MGFLDVVKGIAGKYSPYVDLAGEVAGAVAANRAAGRVQESNTIQAQDRTAVERYQAEQQAKLAAAQLAEKQAQDRATFTQNNAAARAKQVAYGDILANIQPADIKGLPAYIPHMQFSGGAINAIGPAARASGRNLAQQAMAAQLSGSDLGPSIDLSGIGASAPPLTPTPQSGKLDTFLNTIGAIGLGAQGYGEVQDQKKKAAAAAAAQAARNNPQEIPTGGAINTTGAETGTTQAGVQVPGIIGELLRMRQQQRDAQGAE